MDESIQSYAIRVSTHLATRLSSGRSYRTYLCSYRSEGAGASGERVRLAPVDSEALRDTLVATENDDSTI